MVSRERERERERERAISFGFFEGDKMQLACYVLCYSNCCEDTYKECKGSGECVPPSEVCDGHCDCKSCEDEEDCCINECKDGYYRCQYNSIYDMLFNTTALVTPSHLNIIYLSHISSFEKVVFWAKFRTEVFHTYDDDS